MSILIILNSGVIKSQSISELSLVGSEEVGAEAVHSISILSFFFVGSIILDEKAV